MAFVDGIDSHYQAVRARLGPNPTYPVKGFLQAMDWPPKPITNNAFYLLDLGDKPIGKQMYSATVPVKFHFVQWNWVIVGTDLQSGQRADNRGDRFRVGQAMKDALTQALYPNFTEKKTWTLDGSGTWVGTSLVPPEYVTWNPVEFMPKPTNKESGVIYGAAALRIWNMLDSIPS